MTFWQFLSEAARWYTRELSGGKFSERLVALTVDSTLLAHEFVHECSRGTGTGSGSAASESWHTTEYVIPLTCSHGGSVLKLHRASDSEFKLDIVVSHRHIAGRPLDDSPLDVVEPPL